MCRVDQSFIRQRQQFRVQGIVKQVSEFNRRVTQRSSQIGPAHITNKQRVASQDSMRFVLVAFQVVDEQGNRLGRVSGSFKNPQTDVTKFQIGPIGKGHKRILRFCARVQADLGAYTITQFQMPG